MEVYIISGAGIAVGTIIGILVEEYRRRINK